MPIQAFSKWLRRSPLVAAMHYLQPRDAHFEVTIRDEARLGLQGFLSGPPESDPLRRHKVVVPLRLSMPLEW
jgi:hypothetical protein